jgi:hypothetical protein
LLKKERLIQILQKLSVNTLSFSHGYTACSIQSLRVHITLAAVVGNVMTAANPNFSQQFLAVSLQASRRIA